MPRQIDYTPRNREIVVRGRQDSAKNVEMATRATFSTFFSDVVQKRLDGITLTEDELATVDDLNRTAHEIFAVRSQVRALIADPSKTSIDYQPIDGPAEYDKSYTRPAFWTTIPWATPAQLSAESSTRSTADSALQTQIDAAQSTLSTLGSAAFQPASAFDAAGSAAAVTWSTLPGKPTLFSGSWNDLTDKPTLFDGAYGSLTGKPTIPAAQVNSDWNAVSGVAQILNKPILFTGSYTDLTNKPTIPSGQVNSDWNSTSGVSQILNKPTIPAAFTTANARTAISLTVTGVGAATYDPATGVLNIPTPVIPAAVLSGGSAATVAVLIAGGSVDLIVPISPALANTSYQAVAALTNAPISLLGSIALTIKSRATNSVTVTLKNNALATLSLGQVVEVIAIKT